MFKTCRRFDVSSDFIVKLKANDVRDRRNVVMFLTFLIFYLKFLDKILLKIIPRNFKKLKENVRKLTMFRRSQLFCQVERYIRSRMPN